MKRKRVFMTLFLSMLTILPITAQMTGGGNEGAIGGNGGTMMGSGMVNQPVRSERDFIAQMIPHHEDAVNAAILVNVTTSDSEIRALSEKIYTAQAKEILDLKRRFAKQYSALPTGAEMMSMMGGLDKVTGKERDLQFIRQMIPHHQSAVRMAQDVLKLSGISEETRSFAGKVIKDQTDEIAVMQAWLANNA